MPPAGRARLLAGFLSLLVLGACSSTTPRDTPAGTSLPVTSTTRAAATTTVPSPVTSAATPTTSGTMRDERASFVDESLAAMTLEQKIGQLLMVEFSGSGAAGARSVLEEYEITGFLLKSANGNFVSSEQVRELTGSLQSGSTIPLLLAVDQEGGRIDRIRFPDVRRFPAPRVFGRIADPVLTEEAARATGVQLAALGLNVDFAPVADVNVLGDGNPAIGDRSYGDDPELVAEMTVAAVRGFRRAGVAAAVKHFPGHGNTAVDSHLALPVVQTDPATWETTDLVPFAAAVEAGVPMVMVAHVAFPALDPDGLPASLSAPITTGKLREGLGFDGVIVTDDLANMQAVAGWSPGERAVRSLLAGADLILNPGDVGAAVDAIMKAVAGGRIEMSRIDTAVARILGLKYDLGSMELSLDAETRSDIESVAERVAEACRAASLDC